MAKVIEHTDGVLGIQHRCRLACMPRSSYYRLHRHNEPSTDPLLEGLRKLCHEYPRYGYRRVTQELHRQGILVNHKRILALMHKENLLCRAKRRFVRTTDSRHGLPIFANLAYGLRPHQPNELWVADITYVRLSQGFAYVAVVLDAFSRRVIGWAVSTHIDSRLSIAALSMALGNRTVTSGLVHHSDQGVQYACGDYVALLRSKNMTISMSRRGNPYDNALAESFMKTLKTEEVSLNEYQSFAEAKQYIEYFIDQIYNTKRLHSSLGYRPPVEFEALYVNRSILTHE